MTQSAITTSSAQYGSSHAHNNDVLSSSMLTLPPPPQYDGSLYDQRRHAISPPCVDPPYMFREPPSVSSQLTQDSDESWAPAASLNRRGHMTSDIHIDRHGRNNESFRSTASGSSSADDKQQQQQPMTTNGTVVVVSNGRTNSNLPTVQENRITAGTRNASQQQLQQVDNVSSRTWNVKQPVVAPSRTNSKTFLTQHGLELTQRLQPPQPMPDRASEFVTQQGLVLPPPPPMSLAGSDSAERPAKGGGGGGQSKSSTLSSSASSTPRKVDLGLLTKVDGVGTAPPANLHLWQPQLLTKRNLEFNTRGYISNESSDVEDHVDIQSIASTYV